jgi:catechol 2,3-dioxygenase-like lactoylglutathione lyase family enzyme
VRWAIAGLEAHGDDLDGLPTDFVDHPGPGRPPSGDRPTDPPAHPNGVTGLDHVVVATPDLDRTIAALTNTGLVCRRIRDTTAKETPMRQAFFRLGPVVLEVVGPGGTDTGTGSEGSDADAPATWFGLALDVVDLDQTAARLGDGLGPVRPAVQRGRRIATVRHRRLGLSVALAVMDDHGDR